MFFGDGAVQAGHFHETVNLAALWELPLIFVCENNGFAEFTPRSAHTRVERVSDVVAPYGFERHTVDGSDVAAVWAAFGEFLRGSPGQGRGPMLLECLTHRRRGHYEGDAQALPRGAGRAGVAAAGSARPAAGARARRRAGSIDGARRGARARGAR